MARSSVRWPCLSRRQAIYTVDDEVYVTVRDGHSHRIGNTSGAGLEKACEGVYTQGGNAIGHVASDKTTYSVGIDSMDEGRFFLSATRGAGPENLFSRQFQLAGGVLGARMLGVDRTGTGYIALTSSLAPRVSVLCCDAASGNALGRAEVPLEPSSVDLVRRLRMADEGGVAYAQASATGIRYELVDCR